MHLAVLQLTEQHMSATNSKQQLEAELRAITDERDQGSCSPGWRSYTAVSGAATT